MTKHSELMTYTKLLTILGPNPLVANRGFKPFADVAYLRSDCTESSAV